MGTSDLQPTSQKHRGQLGLVMVSEGRAALQDRALNLWEATPSAGRQRQNCGGLWDA